MPTSPWLPTSAQRATLESLLVESKKEKTTVAFAQKYLPFGRSLFDQMTDAIDPARVHPQTGERLPSYFDKIGAETIAAKFQELEQILDEIPRKRLQYSRIGEQKIFVTSKIRAIETAVRECSVKPGPERLVLCPAPTGGGKTMTCNYLAEKLSARLVEVRSSWRRSETGFVPLLDICKAVGVRIRPGSHVAAMEDALVKFCEERSLVLCFDEGEHFGRAALNLVKFLTNKTRIVIVICAVTREYEKWFQYFENEAEQTARRCHAIIETSILDPRDVALFFRQRDAGPNHGQSGTDGAPSTRSASSNSSQRAGQETGAPIQNRTRMEMPADPAARRRDDLQSGTGGPSGTDFADEKAALDLIAREASAFGHYSLVKRVATKLAGVARADLDDVRKALEKSRREMRRA